MLLSLLASTPPAVQTALRCPLGTPSIGHLTADFFQQFLGLGQDGRNPQNGTGGMNSFGRMDSPTVRHTKVVLHKKDQKGL